MWKRQNIYTIFDYKNYSCSGISIVQAASLWDDSGQIYLAWVRVPFSSGVVRNIIWESYAMKSSSAGDWTPGKVYSTLYCINCASTYYPIMTVWNTVLFVVEGAPCYLDIDTRCWQRECKTWWFQMFPHHFTPSLRVFGVLTTILVTWGVDGMDLWRLHIITCQVAISRCFSPNMSKKIWALNKKK